MDIGELRARTVEFGQTLWETKLALRPEGEWYPYGTLANFQHLDTMLTGPHRDLLALAGGEPLVDIGAADGDTAWFLQSLGYDIDIVDNGPTNFNGLRGARLLREHFGAAVDILEVDLDSQFRLPRERYGLAFFLGTLYHLQNPFYALRQLANSARYAVMSTRVAQMAAGGGVRFADLPVAYLLGPRECNDDASNYWIFSVTGLRRLLDRTGWDVLDLVTLGHTTDSDPSSADRDERAFCLIRSRHFS